MENQRFISSMNNDHVEIRVNKWLETLNKVIKYLTKHLSYGY